MDGVERHQYQHHHQRDHHRPDSRHGIRSAGAGDRHQRGQRPLVRVVALPLRGREHGGKRQRRREVQRHSHRLLAHEQFTLGGTDGSKFKMHTDTGYKAAQSGQIQVNSGTSLDYESKSSYSATLRIIENNLSRNIQDYTYSLFIFVTDVNEPPGKPTVTVANNTTTPTTKLDVSWTAPTMTGKPAIDDYDVQYRKTGDSSWSSHSFTGTGTTTTLSGLEAGKKYDVQVRASNPETDNTNTPTTDDSPWSDTANGITQSAAVTRSVAENTAAASNVGAAVTMTAGTYTLAHSLDGTDKDKFEIGATTGQITVKSGTTINYEKADGTDHATAPSYSVTVSIAVTGTGNSNSAPNGTGTYTVPVTINVTDVNEPPPKMSVRRRWPLAAHRRPN